MANTVEASTLVTTDPAQAIQELRMALAGLVETTRHSEIYDHTVANAVNTLFDLADHVADNDMHRRLAPQGLCRTCKRLAFDAQPIDGGPF